MTLAWIEVDRLDGAEMVEKWTSFDLPKSIHQTAAVPSPGWVDAQRPRGRQSSPSMSPREPRLSTTREIEANEHC